jgi:hypothetical protein
MAPGSPSMKIARILANRLFYRPGLNLIDGTSASDHQHVGQK